MQFVKGFYLLHFEGNRVSEFFSTSFWRHFSPKIVIFPLRFVKENWRSWHPPLELSQKSPKSASFCKMLFFDMEKIETTQVDAVFDALSNGHSGISGENLDQKLPPKNIF